jgi:iron complex transport system substrate-binding protein
LPLRRDAGDIMGMRIASLLASATEIVCALSLEDALVAISHECDYPPRVLDRPRVSRPLFDPDGLDSGAIDRAVRHTMATHGSVYALDEEALRRVKPDLILTQEVCEVCAVPTSLAHRAARALDGHARVVSLDAHDIEGILASVRQVAEAAGVRERGEVVAAGLARRLEAVGRGVAGRPRPRVLALEWLDPVFVPGHWGPQMISIAGGECLRGSPGGRSSAVTWEDLVGLDPDALLVAPCGYGLARSRAEADAYRDRLAGVAPRAIAAGRAWVADGSAYFNRSGPRVVEGVELLGRMLHPEQFPEIQLDGRAEVWRGGGRAGGWESGSA